MPTRHDCSFPKAPLLCPAIVPSSLVLLETLLASESRSKSITPTSMVRCRLQHIVVNQDARQYQSLAHNSITLRPMLLGQQPSLPSILTPRRMASTLVRLFG
jgi:hypothetical protein